MRSTTRQKGWNKGRMISESHDEGREKGREWVSKFIPLCLLHSLAKAISITQFNWKAYTVVKIFLQHTSWIFPSALQALKLWKIKHNRKVFASAEKKTFSLNIYSVRCWISTPARGKKSEHETSEKFNPFPPPQRNNIVIVYCLIWIRIFAVTCRDWERGLGLAKNEKQLSLSYAGKAQPNHIIMTNLERFEREFGKYLRFFLEIMPFVIFMDQKKLIPLLLLSHPFNTEQKLLELKNFSLCSQFATSFFLWFSGFMKLGYSKCNKLCFVSHPENPQLC